MHAERYPSYFLDLPEVPETSIVELSSDGRELVLSWKNYEESWQKKFLLIAGALLALLAIILVLRSISGSLNREYDLGPYRRNMEALHDVQQETTEEFYLWVASPLLFPFVVILAFVLAGSGCSKLTLCPEELTYKSGRGNFFDFSWRGEITYPDYESNDFLNGYVLDIPFEEIKSVFKNDFSKSAIISIELKNGTSLEVLPTIPSVDKLWAHKVIDIWHKDRGTYS